MPDFEPARILALLVEHHVDHVLMGGFAVAAHGGPLSTAVVDITPGTSKANLDRLAGALDARVRHPDIYDGPLFSCEGTSLAAATSWELTTAHGDLDVSFAPAGTSGFEGLAPRACLITFRGLVIQLASLDDVVRSKAAAGSLNDRHVLPVLRELLAAQRDRKP